MQLPHPPIRTHAGTNTTSALVRWPGRSPAAAGGKNVGLALAHQAGHGLPCVTERDLLAGGLLVVEVDSAQLAVAGAHKQHGPGGGRQGTGSDATASPPWHLRHRHEPLIEQERDPVGLARCHEASLGEGREHGEGAHPSPVGALHSQIIGPQHPSGQASAALKPVTGEEKGVTLNLPPARSYPLAYMWCGSDDGAETGGIRGGGGGGWDPVGLQLGLQLSPRLVQGVTQMWVGCSSPLLIN